MRHDTREQIIREGVAGLVATVPMTATMLALVQSLPPEERYALEPRMIAERILEPLGIPQNLSREQNQALAMFFHFGYGAAAGAVSLALTRRLHGWPIARGTFCGLALWAASYVGWLPALKVLPPPHERPLGRNLEIILSHLVYGIAAAVLDEQFRKMQSERPDSVSLREPDVTHRDSARSPHSANRGDGRRMQSHELS